MDYEKAIKETVEKIYKRFLKEKEIYGSDEGKKSIKLLRTTHHIFMPLNYFRWDTSLQGHVYWFNMSVDWCIFLFDTLKDQESSDDRNYMMNTAYRNLIVLLTHYLPSDLIETYRESLTFKEIEKKKEDMRLELTHIN
jgi:hypothetical protein